MTCVDTTQYISGNVSSIESAQPPKIRVDADTGHLQVHLPAAKPRVVCLPLPPGAADQYVRTSEAPLSIYRQLTVYNSTAETARLAGEGFV